MISNFSILVSCLYVKGSAKTILTIKNAIVGLYYTFAHPNCWSSAFAWTRAFAFGRKYSKQRSAGLRAKGGGITFFPIAYWQKTLQIAILSACKGREDKEVFTLQLESTHYLHFATLQSFQCLRTITEPLMSAGYVMLAKANRKSSRGVPEQAGPTGGLP